MGATKKKVDSKSDAKTPEKFLRGLYALYKSKSPKDWKSEDMREAFASATAGKGKLSNKDYAYLQTSLTLAVRLAHSVGEDEFVKSLNSGEMPPIKLSSKEIEALKGGYEPGNVGMFRFEQVSPQTWRFVDTLSRPAAATSAAAATGLGAAFAAPTLGAAFAAAPIAAGALVIGAGAIGAGIGYGLGTAFERTTGAGDFLGRTFPNLFSW